MAGKHFCVSFAHPYDASICLQIGQSVMWDNGAFSAYTRGAKFEPEKYYAWLEDKLGHPHWAVIPDVINGDEAQQRELLKSWPFKIDLGCPVWHLHQSLDYLHFLVDNYAKVCFGSSGEYWNIGTEKWERRLDTAFNSLAKNGPMPWVHMLRGLAQSGKRWPFASADSTNVARNYKDRDRCPFEMANEIDQIQTPIFWVARPEQEEMF